MGRWVGGIMMSGMDDGEGLMEMSWHLAARFHVT